MEQKQLDDMGDTFFGEEFIEDLDDFPPAPSKSQEIEIESLEEPKELRLRKMVKKASHPTVKKSAIKKSEKITAVKTSKEAFAEEKPATVEKLTEVKEHKEKKNFEAHVKKETVTANIKPAKEQVKETKPAVEMSSPVNPWEDDSKSSLFKEASTWKALTGLMLVLLILSVFTQGFNFLEKNAVTGAATTTVNLQEAEQKVLTYVNTQLLQAPFQAEVQSSEELDTLYKIILTVAGQTINSYVTKDGNLFFPQGLNTNEAIPGKEDKLSGNDAQAIEVSVDDDDPVLGSANAPVTLVEFSDFQCPFCKKANDESLKLIVKNYVENGKVKMVYKYFPLEFHPEAEPAALAAACADEQNKFWEYRDLLFVNQAELSDANYKKWAEDLDLDTEQFNDCYKGLKYLEAVKKDMADGQKYGVSGTPAFFVNGKMISGAQPYAAFETEIEAALAAAGAETEAPAQDEPELAPEVQEEQPKVEEPVVDEPVVTGETVKLTLNAKKWIFQPNEMKVKKGSTVVVTVVPNDLEFTFAVPALGVEKTVSGTTEVEFVADKAGTFDFTCGSCEDWRGMKGTLVVE